MDLSKPLLACEPRKHDCECTRGEACAGRGGGAAEGRGRAAGYLDAPADVAPYCKSWRDDWVGRVPIVLRPKSTEEVAGIVRICAAAGVAIVPQGGNTGLTGAAQPHPDMSEVIVSTSRLNKIRAVDTVNDTITVEAGVVLKAIQDAADRADRLFPLSLGAEGSCQIGGNISTNAGGVQVLRYGNMRNLVMGLEVVLPDGSVWDGLRGLRKDNTGYDMKQLFIGAEGTLGIITAAVLRLFPKPTARETAWVALDSPQAAVGLLGHMRAQMGDAVSAFELICRLIIDLLITGVPGHEDPMPTAYPWYVLMDVTSQGPPGSLHEPFSEALAGAQEAGLIRDALVASSGAQAAKLWKMRESLVEAQVSAGGTIAHDISVPVSRIPEFIARADAAVLAAYPARAPAPSATSATATCTTIPCGRATGTARASSRSGRTSTASCTISWWSSAARSAPSTASASRGWPNWRTTRRRWRSR